MMSGYHKHVLFIGPDYRNHRGGIGAVLEVYAKHIKPFKFIPTYRAGNGSHVRRMLFFILAICKLIRKLTFDSDINIVHIHSASKGSFIRKSIIVIIGKAYGKKIIYHLHGGNFQNFYRGAGILRKFIRFIIERCDTVICLSEQWRIFMQSSFRIRKLVVVNNIIEPAGDSKFVPGECGKINFLFLGLITKRKGIFDLVEVLKDNIETFEEKISLAIGGNGEVETLKESMKGVKNDYIRYEGWVNGNHKDELLKQCDVYILPSYVEGLPISILEAMSYGKPVISTPVGGIPEIVKPGINGWLFQPGDKAALQNIISEVLKQKKKLCTYGRNSLVLSANYLPENVLAELDKIYSQLITTSYIKITNRAA